LRRCACCCCGCCVRSRRPRLRGRDAWVRRRRRPSAAGGQSTCPRRARRRRRWRAGDGSGRSARSQVASCIQPRGCAGNAGAAGARRVRAQADGRGARAARRGGGRRTAAAPFLPRIVRHAPAVAVCGRGPDGAAAGRAGGPKRRRALRNALCVGGCGCGCGSGGREQTCGVRACLVALHSVAAEKGEELAHPPPAALLFTRGPPRAASGTPTVNERTVAPLPKKGEPWRPSGARPTAWASRNGRRAALWVRAAKRARAAPAVLPIARETESSPLCRQLPAAARPLLAAGRQRAFAAAARCRRLPTPPTADGGPTVSGSAFGAPFR